jgi:hypothetical protein
LRGVSKDGCEYGPLHPSFETHRFAMLLSMNTEPHSQDTVFMVRVQRRFRRWGLRMRLAFFAGFDERAR